MNNIEKSFSELGDFINEARLNRLLKEILNESDCLSCKRVHDRIICIESTNDDPFYEYSIRIETILIPYLRKVFQRAKDSLIKILEKVDDKEYFLETQFKILQNLIVDNVELLNRLPFLLLPIRGLVRFINTTLLLPEMKSFILLEDSINETENDISTLGMTNSEIFNFLLSYMKGNNQKGEIILNEDDFSLLLMYTEQFFSDYKIPTISKKLNPNITRELLKFTFWVLYKELSSTSRINKNYYSFLKNVFSNFDKYEPETLRTSLSRGKFTHDEFIPEFIKNYKKTR